MPTSTPSFPVSSVSFSHHVVVDLADLAHFDRRRKQVADVSELAIVISGGTMPS